MSAFNVALKSALSVTLNVAVHGQTAEIMHIW